MLTSTFGYHEPVTLLNKNFECFSVKFSPFMNDLIACAGASEFGMRGPGRISIFKGPFMNTVMPSQTFDYREGIYDVSWSEVDQNVLVAAAADGSLLLYNLNNQFAPLKIFKEHSKEACCVEWNIGTAASDAFLSTSYDGSIKIWRQHISKSIQSISAVEGGGIVYQATWSPREDYKILSGGSDGSLSIWDLRMSSAAPVIKINKSHDNEVLTVDWNKWNSNLVASASVDCSIKVWDLRFASTSTGNKPINTFRGHNRAIKKIKWSPFNGEDLFSVSYDMTLKCWSLKSLNPLVGMWEGHDEFICGLDVSLHDKSILLATASWDQTVRLLRPPHWGQPIKGN